MLIYKYEVTVSQICFSLLSKILFLHLIINDYKSRAIVKYILFTLQFINMLEITSVSLAEIYKQKIYSLTFAVNLHNSIFLIIFTFKQKKFVNHSFLISLYFFSKLSIKRDGIYSESNL
jgi:hypothetical protein